MIDLQHVCTNGKHISNKLFRVIKTHSGLDNMPPHEAYWQRYRSSLRLEHNFKHPRFGFPH